MTRPSTPTIVFASVVAIFSIVAVLLLFAGARNAPPATPQPSVAASGPTLAPRTPVVPGAPTPDPSLVALDVSWDQAGPVTIVCWTLTTTPPKPQVAATEKIEGPGIAGPSQASIGTDADGVAKGGFVVNQFGTYTVSATVERRTTTKEIAMRSPSGPKPCSG